MTWAPLLLADPSPCLRLLVLRELLGRPEDDDEVRELAGLRTEDPLYAELARLQEPDGSWMARAITGSPPGDRVKPAAQALMRLGYLGFGPDDPVVSRGAVYLFSMQEGDGSWPMGSYAPDEESGEGYSMIPLQTAIPLMAIASCGYVGDPRTEKAYEWLLEQRLPDGAWPTGISSGNFVGVAGYRRLAHSRWGCRSNTTGALTCLALHPERRRSEEAQRALDLLLGRETRERHALGFEVARKVGAETARGFLTYYARFDSAQVLDLCWRVGATREDDRVEDLVDFVLAEQGRYGLWEYSPRPQASRWVTLDVLRSLSRLDDEGDWFSLEPRTPFRAYPKREKRF